MRSLRSLCLLQVHSLGQHQHMLDMSEIPATLAKDIKIMQLVNKSFGKWTHLAFDGVSSRVDQTALSIEYDGVCWSFQSRSNSFDVPCCCYCDFIQPELEQFSLEEGKPAPAWSPFWEASWVLGRLEQVHPLGMIMSFEMNEEGTWGEISFIMGSAGIALAPVVFRSNMVVQLNEGGERKLSCDWLAGGAGGIAHLGSHDILMETPVHVEDAFSTPVLPFCSSAWEWNSSQLFSDEATIEQDPEDFVEDFWRFVAME